jgi:hypothetical protein
MTLTRIQECAREQLRRPRGNTLRQTALELAMGWLCAAQDSSEDGGVSHSYLIGAGPRSGWMRSYPETTGYIIPTMINAAAYAGSRDPLARALRMADWEVETQMPEGAVPDLVGGRPTVFDTGQVIFGYLAAYRSSGDQKYLDAATRGGQWLLGALDEDGVWRHDSDSGGPGRSYNVRVAWSLLELGVLAGDESYRRPMHKFCEWTLSQEDGGRSKAKTHRNGWFHRNCLTTDASPLLHTIAYTARGQFESGLLLGDERLVAASRRTAESLVAMIGEDGYLPGRFRRDWGGAVRWSCLTGMAQLSILLRRFARYDEGRGDQGVGRVGAYRATATRLNDFLCRAQDTSSKNPGLRGGVRGSFPIFGSYGQWRVLNWATKFFVDALLIEADDAALEHPG